MDSKKYCASIGGGRSKILPSFPDNVHCKSLKKNINIFDKPIHIYPINEAEHHWYIIVVVFPTDNNKPYMAVLDSNSKDDGKERVIQNIKNYLTEELQSKSVKSISRKLLEEMETIYPKIPQQEDGSSCGLFALYFVKEIFKRVMFGSLNLMFDDICSM